MSTNLPAATTTPGISKATSTVIVTGGETNVVFAVVAIILPPHDPGVHVHVHTHHAEGCYVVAGILAVTLSDCTTTVTTGTTTLIAPGERHCYWNPTAATTTILLIYRPGITEAEALALAAGSADV